MLGAGWGGTVVTVLGGTVITVVGGTVVTVWGGTVVTVLGGTVVTVVGGTVVTVVGGTVVTVVIYTQWWNAPMVFVVVVGGTEPNQTWKLLVCRVRPFMCPLMIMNLTPHTCTHTHTFGIEGM